MQLKRRRTTRFSLPSTCLHTLDRSIHFNLHPRADRHLDIHAPPHRHPAPTYTSTLTPIPTVESLRATVTADKLTCRYGPGAEYLYLVALNRTARIKLIGRADGNNWVWVENVDPQNRSANCWVNKKFLEIQGDPQALPIVYPGVKLIVSPYYPGPSWASAKRDENGNVVISWEPVPISPGKFANENMRQYLVEVWRCEAGQIIFETLGTNFPFITVEKDEAGCAVPSHGRVYVQEKHGYGGPGRNPRAQSLKKIEAWVRQ